MGRGDLSRLSALLLVVLACAPAATAAGAARLAGFTLYGATEPTGAQAPRAYIAADRAETARWRARLSPAQRERVAALDFKRDVLVAAFLDGRPCVSGVRVGRVAENGRRLILSVSYQRPPVGVATCVRTSIKYVVLALDRSSLARTPTLVQLEAVARS